ncbi:sensor histidine kinase [Caulobacter rhizosphaerae]|jgi:two-component sensor histidine kinase|uniref:sensor histidine kinase n=2 Tax=Caulobacter rhizosphaerae TaxID=2010972 RepID=UPI0013D47F0B|nr:HWE histidine kinase domain-containing protein [Caulobacter rhizosphaerae]GGL49610.1 sensor histidine kinase [Caulobacter rhizosphaerae]
MSPFALPDPVASTPASSSLSPAAGTVRRRLLLMALSLVLPAVLFMVLLARAEFGESRARYERQLIATTRALVLATDRQIGQGQSVLQTLAVSPALIAGDIPAFERQARAAVQGGDGWIVLIDGDRQLVNTRLSPGAPLPRARLPDDRWRTIRAGRTSVSNLIVRKDDGSAPAFVSIDMPVIVDGQLRDLAYIQTPEAFATIFANQNIPPSWTASIVDRNASVVARSKDLKRFQGRQVSGEMRQAMARGSEGVALSHTLDGTPTLSAFSRSPTSGWAFIVGVPRTELSRANWSSVGGLTLASLVLLIIGVAVALTVSQDISAAVRGLSADAKAVAAGEEIAAIGDRFQEIAEVRAALHDASVQLRAREAEELRAHQRQQLMINELNHRVKNTLFTVQSLARQSLGRPADTPGLQAFNERIMALARAHDLLTRSVWEGADLQEILEETLEPYLDRTILAGPPVALTPNAALALSMVFHELGTNAGKYGALSLPGGAVTVVWHVDPGAPHRLTLHWEERGGPPVSPPARKGFGSRLIAATLKSDLAGEARADYRPSGLVCVLTLSLRRPDEEEAEGRDV